MITSNVYFNGASVADDIHVGEKYSRQYADFVPIVQLFLGKKDEKIMEKVKLFNEDVWQTGETTRKCPWFKPDWSPDLLDTCFYFGSVVVLRKELYERAIKELGPVPEEYYNWIRLCTKLITNRGAIGHISQILFHCNHEEVLQDYSNCADRELVECYTKEKCLLSIIIPSKDHPEILEKCLKGIGKTRGKNAGR